MCIHWYLYLRTIDIPAIPPKLIAHPLTHLLVAVLGHSLEFLLLLRGHPVVLLSFWMDGHTLAWKGNFAETLLQSSSIYFTIYHFSPAMIFLYTHITDIPGFNSPTRNAHPFSAYCPVGPKKVPLGNPSNMKQSSPCLGSHMQLWRPTPCHHRFCRSTTCHAPDSLGFCLRNPPKKQKIFPHINRFPN